VLAEAAGFSEHRQWIEQSRREEKDAADAVEPLIEHVTRRYLQMETASA
jgi:hypothetical protein